MIHETLGLTLENYNFLMALTGLISSMILVYIALYALRN